MKLKGFETSTETVFWDRRAFNLDCDDAETGALSSLREGICDIREGCELMESVVVVESRGLPDGDEEGKACPKEGGETFKGGSDDGKELEPLAVGIRLHSRRRWSVQRRGKDDRMLRLRRI